MSAPAADGEPGTAVGGPAQDMLPPLPAVLLEGCAAFPEQTEQALTRSSGLAFVWEREEPDGTWAPACRGLTYAPGAADVGRRLRLVGVVPGTQQGEVRLDVVTGPVQPCAGPFPFERRHRLTQEVVGADSVRLVTYNMLADFYAVRDQAGMSYCPLDAQNIEYRKQLLLIELLGYNADVLCLQEVDQRVFDGYLLPMLGAAGFGGSYAMKEGLADGVATFWRTSKFKLVSTERVVISQLAANDPLFSDVQKALEDNDTVSNSFGTLPHVLQVTVLEPESSGSERARRLVVANTHLYWNRKTEHLRALQAGVCMRHIQRLMDRLWAEDPACEVALFFSGDFNSLPHQSVYCLMTTGEMNVQDFNEMPGEEVDGVTFKHPYRLESACGTPTYTTHTGHFAGCVDYMFFMADKMKVDQVVPLVSDEEVKAHTALPSVVVPSDHLALVADFSWIV